MRLIWILIVLAACEAQNCRRRGSRRYARRRGIYGRSRGSFGPKGLDETPPGYSRFQQDDSWESHEMDFLPPSRPFPGKFYFEKQFRPAPIDDSQSLNQTPQRYSRRRKEKPKAANSDFKKGSSSEESSSEVEPYVDTKTKPNPSGSSKTNKVSTAETDSSTKGKSATETYQWTIQKPVKPVSGEDFSFYIKDESDDEEDNDDNNLDNTNDYRW
uniref:Uncharacterized protein n=1 Tax=Cuerna arida TaxID=1464854 RepID=A0A1B6EXW6_9HEMI